MEVYKKEFICLHFIIKDIYFARKIKFKKSLDYSIFLVGIKLVCR